MDIRDVLNSGPELRWVVARVDKIDLVKKKLTLIMGDLADANAIRVANASYLASYTPARGDVVHALVHPTIGVLVLGNT